MEESDRIAKEKAGWICYPADADQPTNNCFTGFAFKSFYDIANRLKWVFRPLVVEGGVLSVKNLPPPTVVEVGASAAVFRIGLFTSYQIPWRPPAYKPDDFWCSE